LLTVDDEAEVSEGIVMTGGLMLRWRLRVLLFFTPTMSCRSCTDDDRCGRVSDNCSTNDAVTPLTTGGLGTSKQSGPSSNFGCSRRSSWNCEGQSAARCVLHAVACTAPLGENSVNVPWHLKDTSPSAAVGYHAGAMVAAAALLLSGVVLAFA